MNLYEKVNDRIKDDFEILKIHGMNFDLFNLIYKLNYKTLLIILNKDTNLIDNKNNDYLDENEVYYEVAKFFKELDNDYYDMFIKQKNDNKIIYNKDIKNGYLDNDTLTIRMEKTNTNKDIAIMIHEMMHRLNIREDFTYYPINKYLTEFISIFFENYYTYINDPKMFDYQFLNRIKKTQDNVQDIHITGNLYHFYNRHNEFNKNSYKVINSEIGNNYTKEEFDNLLNNYLSNSDTMSFLNKTGYLLGLLLTNYIYMTFEINDELISKMKKLNNAIRDEDLSLYDALKIIDIDIANDETIDDIIKYFEERLNDMEENGKNKKFIN